MPPPTCSYSVTVVKICNAACNYRRHISELQMFSAKFTISRNRILKKNSRQHYLKTGNTLMCQNYKMEIKQLLKSSRMFYKAIVLVKMNACKCLVCTGGELA